MVALKILRVGSAACIVPIVLYYFLVSMWLVNFDVGLVAFLGKEMIEFCFRFVIVI